MRPEIQRVVDAAYDAMDCDAWGYHGINRDDAELQAAIAALEARMLPSDHESVPCKLVWDAYQALGRHMERWTDADLAVADQLAALMYTDANPTQLSQSHPDYSFGAETDVTEPCPVCNDTGIYIGVRDFSGSPSGDGQTMCECWLCKKEESWVFDNAGTGDDCNR